MTGDSLAGTTGAWWDEFFADRDRPVPFFAEWPDENLAEWFPAAGGAAPVAWAA